MMKSNAIQPDHVVVEYQSFDVRNVMITFSFDLFYAVVGHVQETQIVHGAVDAEYVGRQFGHKVAGEYQHLRPDTRVGTAIK